MNIRDLVSAWEADTSRVRTSATGNLDLEAAHIRLGATCTSMQRKHLGTHKVVASSNVLGHRERALAAVGVEDLSAPGGSGALVAVLGDLEERACGRGRCIGDLCHVHQDGAVVGAADGGAGAFAVTGLGVQFYGERGAGCCCQSW